MGGGIIAAGATEGALCLSAPRINPIEADAVLLDAAGVAELLGVPTSWVYAEARAGRLPNVRVGRYRRFRRRAIEDWVGAHEQGPVR